MMKTRICREVVVSIVLAVVAVVGHAAGAMAQLYPDDVVRERLQGRLDLTPNPPGPVSGTTVLTMDLRFRRYLGIADAVEGSIHCKSRGAACVGRRGRIVDAAFTQAPTCTSAYPIRGLRFEVVFETGRGCTFVGTGFSGTNGTLVALSGSFDCPGGDGHEEASGYFGVERPRRR